jgi:hypothetical protein
VVDITSRKAIEYVAPFRLTFFSLSLAKIALAALSGARSKFWLSPSLFEVSVLKLTASDNGIPIRACNVSVNVPLPLRVSPVCIRASLL